MGQAKDKFFQKLEARFANEGFVYKKSKNAFVKTVGEVQFSFRIALDGRGNLVCLLWCLFEVEYLPIQKYLRKMLNYGNLFHVKVHKKGTSNPQNYSLYDVQKAKLSGAEYWNLPYEERYPEHAIDAVVDYMMLGFEQDCRPAMQQYDTLEGIYEALKIYDNEDKNSSIAVFSLAAYWFLRMASTHFGENIDAQITHFLKEYRIMCIDDTDWEAMETPLLKN